VSQDSLQNAIRRLPGMKDIEVIRTGEPAYGAIWIISFVNFHQGLDSIIVSGSSLLGG
jgi:hypothetical protein